MIERTNESMQHEAHVRAMTLAPCDCDALSCACNDRIRSARLVTYASYCAGEASRVVRTVDSSSLRLARWNR